MNGFNFGVHLQRARNRHQMTINRLAERSGVSNSQISRIETGDRGVPKPSTIYKLANGLGVSYEGMLKAAGYIDRAEHKGIESTITSLISWHKKEIERLENELNDLKDINKEAAPWKTQ